MRRIGVLINTAVEHCSGVLPNPRTDKGFTPWMFLDEICHIMNYTGDSNKRFSILRCGNEIVPGEYG